MVRIWCMNDFVIHLPFRGGGGEMSQESEEYSIEIKN